MGISTGSHGATNTARTWEKIDGFTEITYQEALKISESLGLEKTMKIILSNHQPFTTVLTKPCHSI